MKSKNLTEVQYKLPAETITVSVNETFTPAILDKWHSLCLFWCVQEVPLLSAPSMMAYQRNDRTLQAKDVNTKSSGISTTQTINQTSAIFRESMNTFRGANGGMSEIDSPYGVSRDSYIHGNAGTTLTRYTQGTMSWADMYGEIALPATYLNDYYSQVNCWWLHLHLHCTYCKKHIGM